jgi:uncharacterized protein
VTTFFVDSSALAKRYLTEIGSKWVLSWVEPGAGHVILVSELALVEIQSLLARRVREGTVQQPAAQQLRNDFLLHYRDDYLVMYLDTNILQSAGHLVNQHKLRTLDAIQLASAIQAMRILAEPMIFISSDVNLLNAASAEGFATDDPHNHP